MSTVDEGKGVHLLVLRILRVSAGSVWIYQGLVPKLFGPHSDEFAMITALGVPVADRTLVASTVGVIEIVLGCGILFFHKQVWPHVIAVAFLVGLLIFVALFAPLYLIAAFNPVATNIALAGLSAAAIAVLWSNRSR